MSLALGANSPGAPLETADSAQAKAKLAEVRGRIAALTSRLGAQLRDRDALGARLREADLSITAKRRRFESLRAAQLATARRRGELRAEQAGNQGALDAQRAALAAQVRAAYRIGRQEQIKLVLNQSDPAGAGRMLTFYGYFARERSAKIDEIRARVVRLQELAADIVETSAKLQALQVDTARELADLKHAREERVAALAAVTLEVKRGNEELADLRRQEQAEEALVADLARVLQDFPIDTQPSFEGLRGKLPWPVTGKMAMGTRDLHANPAQYALRRNGVLIDTTGGAKVRAPYFGRVVYADWLQGLGLLLIIGHSGNYMTLYGHAEVLYKSVGDWVAPGDVIAALGDSNGAVPQLYFEIRDGRKPVDPKLWLKATP
ncbi:MAG: murein hydrolase activator [Gammaproteobacteria bacterium]|nr:murein hydrolase activator [Gammaproteobacteria bacterium]